ncbi:MAG: CRISPR-associated endonuclease Cas1, partial [Cyanothece sp. SIO2G6]|nr:CRISPR-associated endonuclease Cas1 [Cyanothece sp. SIO2G6]
MQRAMVEALREQQQPIPPPLFVVLGYKVREPQTVTIQSKEVEWRNGMSSLYLVQQGTRLSKEQGRFVLAVPAKERRARNEERGGKKEGRGEEIEIPIREVDRVLVFGNIQLTSAVIGACLQQQIPVVFLSQLGEYKGHLWSAESADLAVEAAQFRRQEDEAFKRQVAREIVRGKLWNSKQLLLRLNRKSQWPQVADIIHFIREQLEAVGQSSNTPTLDHIRGYEGAGAAQYFVGLSQLITNPGFSLKDRNYHPPKDPVNALLSFGYTLLYNNVFSLLLVEGLNPYLGNLHGAERQKAYLAFDLMEEFRSPIVDTLVMRLINQKIIRPTDFSWPKENGGVYLVDPARRVFLKYFEERMSEKVSYPDLKE